MQKQRIGGVFFLVALFGVAVLFFWMLRPFMVAMLLAALAAGLLYPVYAWLNRHVSRSSNVCSALCVLLTIALIIVPLVALLGLFTIQALDFKDTAEVKVRDLWARAPAWIDAQRQTPLLRNLHLENVDLQQKAAEAAKVASSYLLRAVARTSRSAVETLFMVFIMLYSLFFFLIDGPALLNRIKYLTPLKQEVKDQVVGRFLSLTRATLKGTFLIGLIQGGLGGIAFAALGIGSPVFWGTAMVFSSMIPGVGATIIWLPAAIIMLATGSIGKGVGLIIAGCIIGTIDNVLRPRLVGKDTKMHTLLILLSTVGGISLFGILGFVLGPILAAIFVTMADFYEREYSEELGSRTN